MQRVKSCQKLTITIEVTSSQPKLSACTTYMEQESLHVWEIPVAMDTEYDDILQMAQLWSVDGEGSLYIAYIVSLGFCFHYLDRPGCTAGLASSLGWMR